MKNKAKFSRSSGALKKAIVLGTILALPFMGFAQTTDKELAKKEKTSMNSSKDTLIIKNLQTFKRMVYNSDHGNNLEMTEFTPQILVDEKGNQLLSSNMVNNSFPTGLTFLKTTKSGNKVFFYVSVELIKVSDDAYIARKLYKNIIFDKENNVLSNDVDGYSLYLPYQKMTQQEQENAAKLAYEELIDSFEYDIDQNIEQADAKQKYLEKNNITPQKVVWNKQKIHKR